MCIIVDACMAHRFGDPPKDPHHEDALPIVNFLLPKKPASNRYLVVGGKLKEELVRSGKGIRRLMKDLSDRGRLYEVSDSLVGEETDAVRKLLNTHKIAKADDPHVIALARLSGSRVLFTEDNRTLLIDLLRDSRFVKPAGKIYKSKANAHLLKKAPKCKDLRKLKKPK